MEVPGPLLSQSLKKQKKSAPKKFLIFHEMELSISPRLKHFSHFRKWNFIAPR